ncbi:spore germination protein KA [Clostridium aceticum]|uniref:Spore germination protein KA n=1 Tax=Clostridium aceticum TaxID=84022 RepID=A0A0G3WBW0_9CLOT|nr:spore germination protein [Clostridium aceticum]AKL95370.1 spore germination protein KA [Clostridium aceticum]
MSRNIKRPLKYLSKKKSEISTKTQEITLPTQEIPQEIKAIEKLLENIFEKSSDFIIRRIFFGKNPSASVIIVFINGMIDKQLLNNTVIKPLLEEESFTSFEFLKKSIVFNCDVREVESFQDSIDGILGGNALVYVEGVKKALKISVQGGNMRSVEEPVTESVVRGPREGFTESIVTNTSLLRRKIRNPYLRFESLTIGNQTKTEINICYIKGIANNEIIAEVKNRLKKITTESILESGYIEEFIQDAPFSIFPTVANSEKPDIVAAKILEGRVGILCDGTPFVLTVPHLFIEVLQAGEDYYSRWIYSLLVRSIRLMAFMITTMTPAYYVALISFHQDVIPFKLLLTMAASREGIPFSAFLEALLMIFTFELLREAGVRMPRPIGQAVSIVGALVIGDAAVRAGLVSIPMVVVIAITAITSFIIPQLSGGLLIIRLLLLFAANIVGIFGIIVGTLILFIHMCSLKSFQVPYLSPVTPLEMADLKDSFVRYPIWRLLVKPKSFIRKT